MKQIVENFRIISMTPCTTYYSNHYKCHRLAQLISVANQDGHKINIKLYPPFSHNSFVVGDRLRICYLDKQYTDTIKQPGQNIQIKYYQAKSVEAIHTVSPIPYATHEDIQAIRYGYMSFIKLAELYNQWQAINTRQNDYLLKKSTTNHKHRKLPKIKIIFQINIIY